MGRWRDRGLRSDCGGVRINAGKHKREPEIRMGCRRHLSRFFLVLSRCCCMYTYRIIHMHTSTFPFPTPSSLHRRGGPARHLETRERLLDGHDLFG